MTTETEKLLDQALKLSTTERAHLAAELIASVDGAPDPDAEQAWAEEIQRRVVRVETEGSKGESWETVHERIASRLRKG